MSDEFFLPCVSLYKNLLDLDFEYSVDKIFYLISCTAISLKYLIDLINFKIFGRYLC